VSHTENPKKPNSGIVAACVSLAVLLNWGATNLYGQAQAYNAILSGEISDPQGAAVPGANVTLSDPSKGFTRTFTTKADGRYVFTLIPAGDYVLKVEVAGFRPYEQKGIILTVAQSATQDVSLTLGSLAQEVLVTASASILNTSNANISSDVTQRQAVELPLNWRNVFLLTRLDSSVQDSNVMQVAGVGTNSGNAEQDGRPLQRGRGPLWHHRIFARWPLGRSR